MVPVSRNVLEARARYAISIAVRLLCLSDVHGNLNALRAVLAHAERQSFQRLLVAGDLLFPALVPGADALETWRRLQGAQATLVAGTSDRALATLDVRNLVAKTDHERAMLDRMRDLRTELGDVILERMRRLPTEVRIPLEDGRELLLVHGSPADPFEPFSFDMSDEEILALVGDDPADVIVCGGSHTPFERIVADLHVVNVGSVGDAPDARGDGEPPKFAHATWIEATAGGVVVEQTVLPLAAS
jgi:predicted phosphodiesterase